MIELTGIGDVSSRRSQCRIRCSLAHFHVSRTELNISHLAKSRQRYTETDQARSLVLEIVEQDVDYWDTTVWLYPL